MILRSSAHLQSSRRIRGGLNHHSFALARFFSKLLEQLYGEVTGQPSWRVEVTTKDGERLGTGARFTDQLEGDYAAGEVIPCKEKADVEIEGDRILFSHGGCVLLKWRPVAVDNEVDPATSAEEMKAKFADDLTIPNSLRQR